MSMFTTSIYDFNTIEQLRSSIAEGETIVFLGSSGVGKSSLVNALCENYALPIAATNTVRSFPAYFGFTIAGVIILYPADRKRYS